MFDWRGKNTSQASSVGWGRRIYDQGEIEVHVEDKLEGNVLRNLRPAMFQMLMGKDIQISMISNYS